MEKIEKNILLTIVDGWGIGKDNPKKTGNAIKLVKPAFYNSLLKKYPNTELSASGKDVGLLPGYVGSSKVGHLNMGAGRIVEQELAIFDELIKDGSFFKNPALKKAIRITGKKSSIHLLGLLSKGGVHSHIGHLFALLDFFKKNNFSRVYIHPILDGRDCSPKSAKKYLLELEKKIKETGVGKIATLSGRFYALDRDKRWNRTKKAYDLYVKGVGKKTESWRSAIMDQYGKKNTDEFFEPFVLDEKGIIKNSDTIIFFDFRADRARQITKAFLGQTPKEHKKDFKKIKVNFVSFTPYYPEYKGGFLYNPPIPKNTLGEVFSKFGLTQLRIAESEKYAHVTYFFSGKKDDPFKGETRKIFSSPKVRTYDLKPEMSAKEITNYVVDSLKKNKYNLIVQNYANGDMVGHTGKLPAALKAVKSIDSSLKQIYDNINLDNWTWIITADHGNIEKMIDEKGLPYTAHTLNKVPFIFISADKKKIKLKSKGVLGNIAPTILDYLKIKKPKEMIESLIK